ncbi:MAG TPA: CHC2 zinc finger domain-containing protein [Gemmataceae bacterium]|nr:CHC2 zinc finger domain-containing protein [Gemmataceae bacterium]
MPGIDFREARSRVGLAEVLEPIGFAPCRRRGEQVRGPCPVHRSRGPRSRSFAAHLGRGVWHCFRCGGGGNVLDLWAAVARRPLHPAVIDLYQRLGRAVPWLPRAAAGRRAERRERSTMPEP